MRMLVALVALMLGIATAFAQGYPNKPVRIVVGFAAGGPTDVIARIVAQKLSETLGQQFYVENVGGAGGNTAAGQVARAAADGYTIHVVSTGFMVNMSLYAKVPYDAVKDFAPVTLVAYSPNVVIVNPSVPVKDIKELVQLIRDNPGKYSFAGPGVGSTPASCGRAIPPRVQSRSGARAVHRRGPGDPVDHRRATRRSPSRRCRRRSPP